MVTTRSSQSSATKRQPPAPRFTTYSVQLPPLSSSSSSPMEAFRLQKKYPEISKDEMFDLVNRFKYGRSPFEITWVINLVRSAISTNTPGRIDKSAVLQALQNTGESYDKARETLKHVSVDASGKVELEDWVEVRTSSMMSSHTSLISDRLPAQCQAAHTNQGFGPSNTRRKGYRPRLKR